jgi:TonB family protein
VHIDYSNAEKPTGERATSSAPSAGANVVVLSADPALIDLLRDSLAGTHRVWRADDATHAADLIVAAGNAVLLADSSLADHDTREFVTRVHEQFPDLAIIVAGRRDDEAELAELVSQGVIFRFLHKPASADRIRNFVDATLRRQQMGADMPAAAPRQTGETSVKLKALTLPAIKLDGAGIRRWLRRSLLLIPLALIIFLFATWKPWEMLGDQTPDTDGGQLTTAAASRDSAVQKLLDSAGLALSRGELVEPPEQNALELYRAVLARDPGNRVAERGIDRVADELLLQAEKALMNQDLAALASAVDAARSARPDHPRLEFFSTQLERERGRFAKPGKPLRSASTQAETAPVPDPVSARSATSRVQGLVLLANERMRSNQLVGGNDSAHAYLLSARRIDPADTGVQQGVAALASLLQSNARKAMSEGQLDDASEWVHQAVALDVDRPEVAELRSELEVARLGNVREDRARLFTLANQRIAQGRLIEPVADSARHYLDLLRASDPTYEGLPETSALLAGKALAEARRLAAAGNVGGAEALLKAANDAGAPATEVATVATEIAKARTAISPPKPQAPVVLPESALQRTYFVKPKYPPRALERGVGGWVDIEFTVARDGSTRDAAVRASEPAGVFERAALDSVARWRYEPRVVNGALVDQRVSAHVRFELKD